MSRRREPGNCTVYTSIGKKYLDFKLVVQWIQLVCSGNNSLLLEWQLLESSDSKMGSNGFQPIGFLPARMAGSDIRPIGNGTTRLGPPIFGHYSPGPSLVLSACWSSVAQTDALLRRHFQTMNAPNKPNIYITMHQYPSCPVLHSPHAPHGYCHPDVA